MKKPIKKPIKPKEEDFVERIRTIDISYLTSAVELKEILKDLEKEVKLEDCSIESYNDYDSCYYDNDMPSIKIEIQYPGKMPLNKFEKIKYDGAMEKYKRDLAKYNKSLGIK